MKRLNDTIKRTLDIGFSLIGLILLGPILLGSALWIKIKDPGSAFYSQWRVGYEGRIFRIYKLRTMITSAEKGTDAILAANDDNRVIPGCRWMRKSHVDELPQLWNILMGDMSLVGPRPERPEILHELTEDIPDMPKRLAVKPGLTGLAQIRNGYSSDIEGMRRKFEYDMQYIHQYGIMHDLKILLGTIPKIWDRGAN